MMMRIFESDSILSVIMMICTRMIRVSKATSVCDVLH